MEEDSKQKISCIASTYSDYLRSEITSMERRIAKNPNVNKLRSLVQAQNILKKLQSSIQND